MLNWHEGLTTGVPDLDNHPKEIFQKFNEFYAVMPRGTGAKEEAAGKSWTSCNSTRSCTSKGKRN
jgi:hypothetical protein